jgi:serine/threonine protein kinase
VHDFTGIQAIGSGKFGKVFKAIERNTGLPCALKVIFKHMLEKFDFFS